MIRLLKRLKLLHPLTGIIVVGCGAAVYNNYILGIGLGIILICLTVKS
jgi:hypothetical protein